LAICPPPLEHALTSGAGGIPAVVGPGSIRIRSSQNPLNSHSKCNTGMFRSCDGKDL
jgi:hypothetical protein